MFRHFCKIWRLLNKTQSTSSVNNNGFNLNDSKCSAILPIDADSSADGGFVHELNQQREPEMIKILKEKLTNFDETKEVNIQKPIVERDQQPLTPVNSLCKTSDCLKVEPAPFVEYIQTSFAQDEQAPLAQEEQSLNLTNEIQNNRSGDARDQVEHMLEKFSIKDDTSKCEEYISGKTTVLTNEDTGLEVDSGHSDESYDDYPIIELDQNNAREEEEPKILETIQVLDDILNAHYEADSLVKHCFDYENHDKSLVVNECKIAGSFNNWSQHLILTNDENNRNLWFIDIDLKPGYYEYKFIVNGEWKFDSTKPSNNQNNVLKLR
jgi:hypothetical protein